MARRARIVSSTLKGMMPGMQGDIPFRQTIQIGTDGSSTMRMYQTIAAKELEVMRTKTSRSRNVNTETTCQVFLTSRF